MGFTVFFELRSHKKWRSIYVYSIAVVPHSAVKATGILCQHEAQTHLRTVPVCDAEFVEQVVGVRLSMQGNLNDTFWDDTFFFLPPRPNPMKTMHLNTVDAISFSPQIG